MTSWRAIYERMFERGPDSFSRSERETIRAAIEEAWNAGAASRAPSPEAKTTPDLAEIEGLVDSLAYAGPDGSWGGKTADEWRSALLAAVGAMAEARVVPEGYECPGCGSVYHHVSMCRALSRLSRASQPRGARRGK